VLVQEGPEGKRIVAYYSRTFNKAERRHCVTRRELLAIVRAVCRFKYYLCGLPFMVRTDHSALQWLMSFKEPEGQAYSFTVEHRAGARHANADALSRRPCSEDGCRHCERRESREEELLSQEEGCSAVEVVCRELPEVDTMGWRQQQEDTDLQPVHRWVELQQRPPWEEAAILSPVTKGLWGHCSCVMGCFSGPGRNRPRER